MKFNSLRLWYYFFGSKTILFKKWIPAVHLWLHRSHPLLFLHWSWNCPLRYPLFHFCWDTEKITYFSTSGFNNDNPALMYSYLQNTVLRILPRGYGFIGAQFRWSTLVPNTQHFASRNLSEKGVYFFFFSISMHNRHQMCVIWWKVCTFITSGYCLSFFPHGA